MTFYVLGKGNAAGSLRQTLRAQGMTVIDAEPKWLSFPAVRRAIRVVDTDDTIGPVCVDAGRTLDVWERHVIEALVNVGLPVLIEPIESKGLLVKVPPKHAELATVALYRALTRA